MRSKLRLAKALAEMRPDLAPQLDLNIAALEKAQPKDLDASEISVRLGSTWVDKEYTVLESIEGYSITSEQKFRMQIVHSHLEYIENSIAQLDTAIDTMIAEQEGLISLMCTIPGVDRNTAITVISEVGTDMAQFGSSKRLCCWAGLTPGNNESAGKKKSVRITRAGVYLKPALVQAAHAAVKATESSYYRLKYEQISKRRGKNRAIIAIARMILTAIFTMMSTGEVYPIDFFISDSAAECSPAFPTIDFQA